jgi:hypothetical protein
MSYLRPSRAVDFVRPVTACLVAVSDAEPGRGACAASDPLLMMRPPGMSWLFMMRNASCVQRNIPVRFTATTCFHCSYVRSSSGARGTGGTRVVEEDVHAAEGLDRPGEAGALTPDR